MKIHSGTYGDHKVYVRKAASLETPTPEDNVNA